MKRSLLVTAAALLLIAACSAAHPAAHRTASPPAAAPRADCAKLTSSSFPPAAFDQLLTREVSRIAGGGTASRSQVRRARRVLAAEIRLACPQFTSLARG